jgi:hypothetical protein
MRRGGTIEIAEIAERFGGVAQQAVSSCLIVIPYRAVKFWVYLLY